MSAAKKIFQLVPESVQSAARLARFELARTRREHWYLENASRQEFFRRAFLALAFNEIAGDYAEFGCWSGNTFSMAFHESRRAGLSCKLWAFDSFHGLPSSSIPEDQHPKWTGGALRMSLEEFHTTAKLHGIPTSVYEVIPGYYDTTLAPGAPNKNMPSKISLAYIDCDLYSSTMSVLRFLLPYLKNGMILAFDDYFCYAKDGIPGEKRACNETFDANPKWRLVPYIQYGWSGLSFLVESKQLGTSVP
jgi:O-methyltransferase